MTDDRTVGVERTEKICVRSGFGYVSWDQDRVKVGFIRHGLDKVCNVFGFVQGKMLSCSLTINQPAIFRTIAP